MTPDFQTSGPANIPVIRRTRRGVYLMGSLKGDVMKVWPPGKHEHVGLGSLIRRRAHRHGHPAADLGSWVLNEEKLLMETRFGGNAELYGAWRDHLWAEMHDTMRRPDRARRHIADEEYVVMTAFDGNWAQYRVCRDRLREELWQIMKVTNRR
jgi:hypothetical protein